MKTTLAEKFAKPIAVGRVELAFGGDMAILLPPYEEVPDEFKDWNSPNKWNKIQSHWFYKGLPDGTAFQAKDGIDLKDAINHLKAIQVSWAPKHEHKEAGVSYLMSLWFDDIIIPAEVTD